MLNFLIADDEQLARETVCMLLSNHGGFGQVWEAETGTQALDLARKHQPDIVLLDIELPGMTGIEVAKGITHECVIIFITAFDEFAVTAFELNAVDYLLKPFEDQRFYDAIEKAQRLANERQPTDYQKINAVVNQLLHVNNKTYKERLVIRDPGRIRLIDVCSVKYVTGAGNYAEVHLDDGNHVLHRETLTALESQLNPDEFVRIHRSTIVRRSAISELRPNDKGDYSVILTSGETLTLSLSNKDKLEELTG